MPRARIVEIYRTFIRNHRPLAGNAAPDVLAWRSRDARPDCMVLLKAQTVQYPIAELALLHDLDSTPPFATGDGGPGRRRELSVTSRRRRLFEDLRVRPASGHGPTKGKCAGKRANV